ncbi:TlpA disulfide reductase family protein [Roseomonas elaeocarpi]|uniref:TlpA disulfide reductase family protein n=1 Tax=Roseomonas elaeocarpi TaxID=907779 RepID=A0ABV6JMT1_9PROT
MLRIGRRQALAATLATGALSAGTLSMTLPARPARAQGGTQGGGPSGDLGQLREGEPKPLPALRFTDAEGTAKTLGEFRGQGVVMNFWATWCGPCVEEMPSLDRLAAALAGDGIAVLPLSSDRGGAPQVKGFYAAHGVRNLAIWLDPQGAAGRQLGIRGLPTTVILDRQGQEVARLEGAAAWDAPDKLAAIRRLAGPRGGDALPAGDKPTAT